MADQSFFRVQNYTYSVKYHIPFRTKTFLFVQIYCRKYTKKVVKRR